MNITPDYFASSNSMTGFYSYFDTIYNPRKLEKIYIIKGGPGTGKSSMIKAVKSKLKNRNCEMFLCSSDTHSYDGILIDNKIAVIDGTSPHSVEAKIPGAVESIIDNGCAITEGIKKYKSRITELADQKSKLYRAAYVYLKASGEIKKDCTKTVTSKMYNEKIDAAISRFFKQNFIKKGKYDSQIRLTKGITPNGMYSTHSFENLSKKTALIVNGKGIEESIYLMIIEKAKEYGINTTISYDPLIPYSPDGLMFTDNSFCVVNFEPDYHGEIDYDKYKIFNCERFIDKNELNEIKGKLKFAFKCHESLLKEAQNVHKELEEIYINNTNYKIIKEKEEQLIDDISSLISNA